MTNKHVTQTNIEKERSLSSQSEKQLQEIISSLRDQLSRPSQAECEAVNSLTSLKHKHFNETEEMKNQVIGMIYQ